MNWDWNRDSDGRGDGAGRAGQERGDGLTARAGHVGLGRWVVLGLWQGLWRGRPAPGIRPERPRRYSFPGYGRNLRFWRIRALCWRIYPRVAARQYDPRCHQAFSHALARHARAAHRRAARELAAAWHGAHRPLPNPLALVA